MPNTVSPKLFILATIAAVSMGTIGIFSRLSELDAATVTFFRLIIGGGLLLVLMFATGQKEQFRIKPHPLMLLNGVMLAGFMTFFIAALNHTSILIAIMTLYMAPVVATVVAHYLLKERLNQFSIVSITIVVFGFTLVMYQAPESSTVQFSWIGLAYALAGMACYAGFILINRMIPTHYLALTKCSWQFLIGALCVVPMLSGSDLSLSISQWGWMLLVGIFPGFIGIVLAVYTIKRMPAATFSTISYIEPISAVILGWLVFQETLTSIQIAGCAIIILASVAQATKPTNQKQPSSAVEVNQ